MHIIQFIVFFFRYLSTGMSFRSLSFSYRISHSAIRQIIYETCLTIWDTFRETHMPVPSVNDLKNIANDYFQKWNFPNCVGCIDGKHIRIKCPKNSGSFYYNYKQYFSIVLQGIADANCKFVTIDIGAYGKQSDGGIFALTNVYKRLATNTFNMPNPDYIPSTDIKAPFLLLGDEAYPLKSYLLKPYSRRNLSNEERIFNYRLSRARRCIECSFGILVAKWRFLKTELQMDPKNVDVLVKCACLLHNLLIDKEGIPSQLDQNFQTVNLPLTRRYNHYGATASEIRDIFKNYFCSPYGEVQFQYHIFR